MKKELATAKASLKQTQAVLAQAQSDLATRTTERDTATAALAAQTALVNQQAAAQVAGMLPDQIWSLIDVVYTYLPNSSLCGYGRSFYSSGNYTSYTFTRYIC